MMKLGKLWPKSPNTKKTRGNLNLETNAPQDVLLLFKIKTISRKWKVDLVFVSIPPLRVPDKMNNSVVTLLLL